MCLHKGPKLRMPAGLNQSKINEDQFVDFLIATPLNATTMEAQRTQPISLFPIAPDAYMRLLHRLEPDSATLCQEVEAEVQQKSGVLILDDSVLDKPHAQKIELVHHRWSGKHRNCLVGLCRHFFRMEIFKTFANWFFCFFVKCFKSRTVLSLRRKWLPSLFIPSFLGPH